MDLLEALVDDVLANREEDARWLVLADHLAAAGDPLGELITIHLTRGEWAEWRPRIAELGAAWQERHAPWAVMRRWSKKTGVELHIQEPTELLDRVEEVRRMVVPVSFRIRQPNAQDDDNDTCVFNRALTRLAWMRCVRESGDNYSDHGPSWDYDARYYRDIKVWRVADRALLHEGRVEAEWRDPAFHDDDLYARDSYWRGEVLIRKAE